MSSKKLEQLRAAFIEFETRYQEDTATYQEKLEQARVESRAALKAMYAQEGATLHALYASAVRGELPKEQVPALVRAVKGMTRAAADRVDAIFEKKADDLKQAWSERHALAAKSLHDFLDQLLEEI